ncbi:GTPase Era [Chrysiogenes arsenatis]|uniref:GTPase Era n=1 Tax=Chrysiogenes arsenatis TaxID=309797 RepID=UPI000410E45C|nr:GTPase Era [Chrysiogenes arsenatis]
MSFKSGFVGIIGRPNVGKSTLMATILGQKISIISDKPQTTRNRILGVWHTPDAQVIFVDTPGVHRGKHSINTFMLKSALSVLDDTDLILLMVDYRETGGEEFDLIRHELARMPKGRNVILIINKIDLAPKKEAILLAIERLKETYPFRHIVPISATTGENLTALIPLIIEALPEGPRYFPEDMITDRSERFLVAEFIREKIFHLTHDEIPHSVAVTIDSFTEEPKIVKIEATIHVERQSQKGIIIGKKGAVLREIGTTARIDLEALLGVKIFLQLFVRVSDDWRKQQSRLREFGYSDQSQ